MDRADLIKEIKKLNKLFKIEKRKEYLKDYQSNYMTDYMYHYYHKDIEKGRARTNIYYYIYKYGFTEDEILHCGDDRQKYKQLAEDKKSSI